MENIDMNEANIGNLTSLWKKMGVVENTAHYDRSIHRSLEWPNRHWLDWHVDRASMEDVINQLTSDRKGIVLPLWGERHLTFERASALLASQGLSLKFEQLAMYLKTKNYQSNQQNQLNVVEIKEHKSVVNWIEIASQAFGYDIDCSSIKRASRHAEVTLLLADIQGTAVATAMLYKTGKVTGVHQVGVPASFRGQGIARNLMHEVIAWCIHKLESQYIVLQASKAGEGLYRSLGFEEQFTIRNFHFDQ